MRELIKTLAIWTICFAAISASVIMTYRWYVNRGPIIRIELETAVGLVPGQSKVIYRGVEVGDVKDIDLNLKNGEPVVVVRIHPEFAKMIGEKSKFWLVKPEFSIDRISNLSTITTGNYISVEPIPGKFSHHFIGVDTPVAELERDIGINLNLYIPNLGGINSDSPVLYRGLKIGEILSIDLDKDKRNIHIKVAIYKGYEKVINKSSIFANSSGFHANFSLFGGANINMESLRSLLIGGISVYTANLNNASAKNGDSFRILTPEQFKKMLND